MACCNYCSLRGEFLQDGFSNICSERLLRACNSILFERTDSKQSFKEGLASMMGVLIKRWVCVALIAPVTISTCSTGEWWVTVASLRLCQDTQSYFWKQALAYEISGLASYLTGVCHMQIFPGEWSCLALQILPRNVLQVLFFFSFYKYPCMTDLIVLWTCYVRAPT